MLPYGASRDVSTDHENQLDENRRTLVSLLPASTRLTIILNAFHAVFDLISSVIITSGIVLVFKNISNFSNWIEEMIPINLERVWKNNFLEKIFRMFNYIYSSWKKKMNFIFYHIESKWNLDGNFSILNCRFKGYVNCIHKVSDLGSWFSSPSIPFGPLVSRRQTTPSHSPENESSPISPEVATPLSSWVGLRTTIFSSLQSRGFISWMIVTKIHRPCLYYLLSLVTLSLFHYPLL